MTLRRPLGEVAAVSALALASAATIIAATAAHGPGVSPDSAVYLSVAESLASGDGLVEYDGRELVAFPPGYPLVIAGVELLPGTSALTAARIVNAVALAAVLVACWVALRVLAERAAIRLGGLALVMLSPVVVRTGVFAWSELPFIAVALVALLTLDRAIRDSGRSRWLVAAALATGMACTLRYAGIVLLPLGGVALLMARGRRWRPAVLRAGALLAAAAVLPAAWSARNLSLGEAAFGQRDPRIASTWEVLREAVRALSRQVAPFEAPRALRVAALVFLVAAFAETARSASRRRPLHAPPLLWILGGFAGLQFALLLLVALMSDIDWGDDRLLAPVVVPAVLASCAALDVAVSRSPRGFALRALAAAAFLVVGAAFAWSSVAWLRDASHGLGYADAAWRTSPTMALVRHSRLPDAVYSNAPDAVWHLTGLTARCWPRALSPGGCSGVPSETIVPHAEAALVWLEVDRPDTRPMLGRFEPRSIAATSDGAVYVIRPRD